MLHVIIYLILFVLCFIMLMCQTITKSNYNFVGVCVYIYPRMLSNALVGSKKLKTRTSKLEI